MIYRDYLETTRNGPLRRALTQALPSVDAGCGGGGANAGAGGADPARGGWGASALPSVRKH